MELRPKYLKLQNSLRSSKKIILLWGEEKKINILEKSKFKESKLLMLSNLKARKELDWYPRLSFDETVRMTVNWYKNFFSLEDMEDFTRKQIDFFSNK